LVELDGMFMTNLVFIITQGMAQFGLHAFIYVLSLQFIKLDYKQKRQKRGIRLLYTQRL